MSVKQLLEERGVDMTGWQLINATGASADGNVIVGYGMVPTESRFHWLFDTLHRFLRSDNLAAKLVHMNKIQ